MQLRPAIVVLLTLAAACGKKAPETTPTTDPNSRTTQPPPAPPPPPPPPSSTRDTGGTDEVRERVMAALTQPIYFDYDQDAIRSSDLSILDQKAAIMAANPALRIRISGHADERGSDEYNLVLGTRRASIAKRYLESKGIDGSRIEVVSYGEERPSVRAGSEDAFARNRRDEFEVISGGDRLVPPR